MADRGVEAGRGALFIGFGKVFFMFTGFVQKVLLTRLLGLDSYGAFSVVNNAVSTVNNAVVQGTIQSISKFTAEADDRKDAVKLAGLRMQAFLGTGVVLAFLLGAPLIADAVNAPDHVGWFRIAAAIPFLYSFYSVFVGSANGLRRFRAQAGFDVGFSSLKTVLLLSLAGLAGVTGGFVGFVLAAAAILVISARVMGLPRRGSTPFSPLRLLVFMGSVVAYTLLINLALNYDLLLLRRFAGAVLEGKAASALAGSYDALRNLALLPYQALIVVTFVIFPLVSRATFSNDREATRSYVSGALRWALILAGAMGCVLAARPQALLAILYPPQYGGGAPALAILVAGECCLALLGVACAILNAAGRVPASLALVGITIVVGAGCARAMVPTAEPGTPMLVAAASATATGMAAGLVAAVTYLRVRFGAGPPVATVARVAAAVAAGLGVGRLVPGTGKVVGLGATAAAGVVFVAALLLLRELTTEDRAKMRRILRRR